MNFRLFIPIIIFSLFCLGGCQQEITEIIDPQPEEVFSGDSQVADLILRTSLNDGSSDNIIDGSSCISLVLPVTVVVNGKEVKINSQDDFKTVEHILDEFDDDDDTVKIIFPVTVVLADHSQLTINNEDDFEDLTEDCVENGDDDDIECVDFKYPLNISIYDSDNELAKVVTIDSDDELYDLMHDMDDKDFIHFNFPITVVWSNGDELVIENNDELDDVLKNAINACDEDDDNDYNDDDADDTELVNVLTDGHWAITYFFHEKDETENFNGYVFTYFENGSVKAKKDETIIEGEWESNGDDGSLELELEFEGKSYFEKLKRDWEIIEFDSTIIKLKHTKHNEPASYLTFERPSGN